MVKPLKGARGYAVGAAGQRIAQRGSVASRPWHEDWAREQAAQIVAQVSNNPWIQSMYGPNLDVRVKLAPDGTSVAFVFTRLADGSPLGTTG